MLVYAVFLSDELGSTNDLDSIVDSEPKAKNRVKELESSTGLVAFWEEREVE